MIMLLAPWMAGCSAIRLGYANGPQLAWWWLDGYVDFSRDQTPAAKQAIDRWFDWHRNTQLADYAALLASTQAPILEPTTRRAGLPLAGPHPRQARSGLRARHHRICRPAAWPG
jgi:hypothetical protein